MVFLFLSIIGLRQWLVRIMAQSLVLVVGAEIGVFIARSIQMCFVESCVDIVLGKIKEADVLKHPQRTTKSLVFFHYELVTLIHVDVLDAFCCRSSSQPLFPVPYNVVRICVG